MWLPIPQQAHGGFSGRVIDVRTVQTAFREYASALNNLGRMVIVKHGGGKVSPMLVSCDTALRILANLPESTAGSGAGALAHRLNDAGQIIGKHKIVVSSDQARGFIWLNGAVTDIGRFAVADNPRHISTRS